VASKESGVAAPFVLAAYRGLFHRGDRSRFWTVAIGGGLVAVVAFLAARFLLEPSPSRIFETRPEYPGGSLWEAVKIEPRILAFYAQLIVCPVNLCADYGGFSVGHLPLWVALVVLTVLAVFAAIAVWRDQRIAFGLALVLVPLLPVSNLVPIYRAAADRYLYLPLAGVACIAAHDRSPGGNGGFADLATPRKRRPACEGQRIQVGREEKMTATSNTLQRLHVGGGQ
jgi:hypothetical protein